LNGKKEGTFSSLCEQLIVETSGISEERQLIAIVASCLEK